MEMAGEEANAKGEEGEWKREERPLVTEAAVGRRREEEDEGESVSLLSRTELSQSLWKNLSSTKRFFTIWCKAGDALITRISRDMREDTSSAIRRHSRLCDASCRRKSSMCISRNANRDLRRECEKSRETRETSELAEGGKVEIRGRIKAVVGAAKVKEKRSEAMGEEKVTVDVVHPGAVHS